jgi:hypothetical protein
MLGFQVIFTFMIPTHDIYTQHPRTIYTRGELHLPIMFCRSAELRLT